VSREGQRNAAYIAWLVTAILGLWVLIHEISYAHSHPHTDLSGVLEAVGVAVIAVAIGGATTTALAWKRSDEE
jgi:threonine/homoserine efflux transporter RhtA